MEIEFPYVEEESDVLDTVKRPRIKMNALSELISDWITIDEVLADTGADFCVLPRYIGETLVKDITTGKYAEIKGVVPGTILVAYVHQIKVRIGNFEFETPVAIADSNDVPSILGRVEALDRFDANFLKGKTVKLRWKE
jgi:predicted aspartyl protease